MAVETIYIPLLNEGTEVWRPVDAERLPDGTYVVLGPMPDDEDWEFKPRERVVVAFLKSADGSSRLVADRRAIKQKSCPRLWDEVEQLIAECIDASPEPFSPATIANVKDFLIACRARCSDPVGVAKGYWSTICVSWEGIEVEICDDRYEYYRFKQGATDIECFDHVGGAEFPRELLDRLPCRKIET